MHSYHIYIEEGLPKKRVLLWVYGDRKRAEIENVARETGVRFKGGGALSADAVVVNGLYPVIEGLDVDPETFDVALREGEAEALRAAARFRMERMALQAEQVRRLSDALPLAQLRLPFLFTTEVGAAEIDALAAASCCGATSVRSKAHSRPTSALEIALPKSGFVYKNGEVIKTLAIFASSQPAPGRDALSRADV